MIALHMKYEGIDEYTDELSFVYAFSYEDSHCSCFSESQAWLHNQVTWFNIKNSSPKLVWQASNNIHEHMYISRKLCSGSELIPSCPSRIREHRTRYTLSMQALYSLSSLLADLKLHMSFRLHWIPLVSLFLQK